MKNQPQEGIEKFWTPDGIRTHDPPCSNHWVLRTRWRASRSLFLGWTYEPHRGVVSNPFCGSVFFCLRWIKAWVLVTSEVLWFDLVFYSIFLHFNFWPLWFRPKPLLDLKHHFYPITWQATLIIMQNLDFADYTTLMNVAAIVFPSIIFYLQSNKLN